MSEVRNRDCRKTLRDFILSPRPVAAAVRGQNERSSNTSCFPFASGELRCGSCWDLLDPRRISRAGVDIGLLRTTLIETGNLVGTDLYNRRIVRMANSAVLKGAVFNYSQGFQFICDEIRVLFTLGSDGQLARAMLLRVAKEAIGEYIVEAQTSWDTTHRSRKA